MAASSRESVGYADTAGEQGVCCMYTQVCALGADEGSLRWMGRIKHNAPCSLINYAATNWVSFAPTSEW